MSVHRGRVVAVLCSVVFVVSAATAPRAFAQAPVTGPLILHVPASARTAALGNAWVAGRDADVIFHNPAQLIGQRQGFDLSVTRLGPASTMASIGSVFAAGKWSLTFGWGAQIVGFNADAAVSHPYSPDLLQARGSRSGSDALVVAGAAIVFKGFRIGVAGKYVSELASPLSSTLLPVRANHQMVLADVGVARNMFGGTAALAFQNLGRHSHDNGGYLPLPRQLALGWSSLKQAGPLDLGLFTQVAARKDWVSPAAGLEVGYSWIDGYNVTFRLGGRRTETNAERPISMGAALRADRLTVEYAVRFFHGGYTANGVTVRWR